MLRRKLYTAGCESRTRTSGQRSWHQARADPKRCVPCNAEIAALDDERERRRAADCRALPESLAPSPSVQTWYMGSQTFSHAPRSSLARFSPLPCRCRSFRLA